MKYLAVLAAVLLLAVPASSQMVTGATGGATFVLKDGKTINAGEVLGEVGYRFNMDSVGSQQGELVALYGAQVNSGQIGGIGYRHYLDLVDDNKVKPGFGVIGFALGGSEDPIVDETSIFVGGELLLRIDPQDDDSVVGYAGFYDSVRGDDASIIRFGVRISAN